MSIHKLTAGSGYDYLTRQVAALDATDKGHVGLASYYTERGETPGVWLGSGMAGIDGLAAGGVVTAEQMQALFGSGHHPLATERIKELDTQIGRPDSPRPTEKHYRAATRLGVPYKVYTGDVSDFRIKVAKRAAAVNEAAGLPGDWPVPAAERARIRTEVARELFVAEHGRPPTDAREIAAVIAKHSRPRTNAVAGYDLTFSPVKSVSVLWAVADPAVAAKVELAHQAAVNDALAFLEQHALYTRTGTNGVRQVDVRGMVATAFTHRDSRAGDPDLHTHIAVANKVQTSDGRWLAIDGRVLFKAGVATSETYNTALEKHLSAGLGVRFAERPTTHTNPPGDYNSKPSMIVEPPQTTCYEYRVTESMSFGPLIVRFDDQVLRPRPWTLAQSTWAAELSDDVPDGAILELCAGVGQIGLALASLVSRDLVLVDADENACSHARANAMTAGLSARVDVRNGPLHGVLDPDERFAFILADPPWVRSSDVARYPQDPVAAIDGGHDGLDLARTCADLIGHHLAHRGGAILQLGDADQVTSMRSYLDSQPRIGLRVQDAHTPGDNGVLVRLVRRE